jgi:ATP-dependent helicase/nuclease subunit B
MRIIDYKTSDQEISPIAAHLANLRDDTPAFAQTDLGGKAKRWTDLQLPLYHGLLQANGILTGETELAYFNLPKAVMQTGLSIWQGWTPALLDSATGCAEAIVERIRTGIFWPPAERVQYDNYETLFPDSAETCFTALPLPGGQPQ